MSTGAPEASHESPRRSAPRDGLLRGGVAAIVLGAAQLVVAFLRVATSGTRNDDPAFATAIGFLIVAGFVVAALGVVLLVFAGFQRSRAARQAALSKLERSLAATQGENDAAVTARRRLRWDYANQKLDLYFSNNLAQGAQIYLISLITILLGFTLTAAGAVKALTAASPGNAAWVAVLGGALTQFIGGTLLLMFRSTVQQSTIFIRTLEHMVDTDMALDIVESLDDAQTTPATLRDATKARLALALVGGSARAQMPAGDPGNGHD